MGLKFRGGLIGLKPSRFDKPEIAEKGSDPEHQSPPTDGGVKEADVGVDPRSSADNSVGETKELQFGVQAAEATLQVWTKNHLIAAYIL